MTTDLDTQIANARRHAIGDLPRRAARRSPAKLAIRCGTVSWSFAEFDRICNRLANGLLARGIVPGDRVAILSRNSHAFAALRFALARIGAVLVPINFMLNADEIAFILKSSGAKALAVGPEFVSIGQTAAARETKVAAIYWLPGEDPSTPPPNVPGFDDLLASADTPPAVVVEGAQLAQIVYTSGTESLPKGAMLSHDAVLWQYMSCIVEGDIAAGDTMLHALPFYHCAQLDVFLGPAMYLGASSIVTGQPRPEVILPLLAEHRVNSFFAPPSIWIALMRSPQFETTDLSALQKGYYGASIMPVEVLKELQQRLPSLRLWNFYGQTEVAPLATVLKPEDQMRKAGSAGKAAINVEVRIVDDDMHDVAAGEIGEVVHRSPQLLSGYFNDPERTRDAFAGGWFHSGDLATIDTEGYITIVDRKKDMIKSGGENVASREVEEMIYRMPQVSEVAVIGFPDPYWIEAVTAIIVVKTGQQLDVAGVIDHCRRNMAHFKVPKRVVFTDTLPKNPSGKLLKRDLRSAFAPPVAPGPSR